MVGKSYFGTENNVVSLAAFRQQSEPSQDKAPERPDIAASDPCLRRDVVYFITGGRYQCMLNGAVAAVQAGDFVRVPVGAIFSFRDVGLMPGTMLCHRFRAGLDSALFREIAAALLPFARKLPARGTVEFRQLAAIERRWGIKFDGGAAA